MGTHQRHEQAKDINNLTEKRRVAKGSKRRKVPVMRYVIYFLVALSTSAVSASEGPPEDQSSWWTPEAKAAAIGGGVGGLIGIVGAFVGAYLSIWEIRKIRDEIRSDQIKATFELIRAELRLIVEIARNELPLTKLASVELGQTLVIRVRGLRYAFQACLPRLGDLPGIFPEEILKFYAEIDVDIDRLEPLIGSALFADKPNDTIIKRRTAFNETCSNLGNRGQALISKIDDAFKSL